MKKIDHKKGFSLVELMVASALFMIVVAVAASAFVSMLDASAQSREMNVLMSNLDFALEDMSRNIRVGERFDIAPGNQEISFDVYVIGDLSQKCRVTYRLHNNMIWKARSGSSSCNGYGFVPITSEEINIEKLTFAGDRLLSSGRQPRVVITLSGHTLGDIRQDFSLQTSVTQRALNL